MGFWFIARPSKKAKLKSEKNIIDMWIVYCNNKKNLKNGKGVFVAARTVPFDSNTDFMNWARHSIQEYYQELNRG